MLEFDGQALDPAIVSAQPMKPVQSVDLQHLCCPSSELHLISLYSDRQFTASVGHGFQMYMLS